MECAEPRRLREAVRETLRDAPRSGSPGRFTAEQIAQIIAVACEPPEKSGRPITHWTHRELKDEVEKRSIVDSISESYLGVLLRQAALQPHRRKMWLNTTEKDPVRFAEQVRQVCDTYRNAPTLHAERGVHTVSSDELTGVQALERNAASEPMQPGQVARDEFEYTRHGTTTVIGNMDVVTGELIATTIGPTRTEVDFVNHIAATVSIDPGGEWVFVVDTLNIHWSAGLVEWINEHCELNQPLGKKGKQGVLKNQASRRKFLSDPSHRVRFVFLPKHSSWLNQIETQFGVINRKVVRRGNFASVADLEDKLRRFIEYFNATMAQPFNWTYTGKPLTTPRRVDYCPPHRRRRPSKITLARLAASCVSNSNLSD